MLYSLSWPVGHLEKCELLFRDTVPSQPMEKPGSEGPPTSHWNWDVGGVMKQCLPLGKVSSHAVEG